MPATLNVNFMTVVHAGSSGMAMSFPDVCKTPAPPAPPIPIPYPNIAQSSDTADGSTTVKVDGNPIMLKSSNFSMSTGDEAGSLNGVVSNKIKGKAEPMNASFDVKVDGKAVFRLTDPMTANGGSAANALAPAEVQAPAILAPSVVDFCKKMVEKAKDEAAGNAAMEDSGVHPKHWDPMKKVCSEESVVLYVRQTKGSCRGKGTKSKRDWIGEGGVPKPHVILNGSTIHEGNVYEQKTKRFLDAIVSLREAMGEDNDKLHEWIRGQGLAARGLPDYDDLISVSRPLFAEDFQGVIGHPAKDDSMAFPISGPTREKRLLGLMKGKQGYVDQAGREFHRITNDSGRDYTGKWMTADYDLFDVMLYGKGCQRVTGKGFEKLRKRLNIAMDWDGIQHGAQVHWVPEKDHGLSDAQRANMDFKSMPDEVAKVLKEYNAKKKADAKADCSGLVATEKTISKEPDVVDPKTGQKTPGQTRKMGVIDANVTAVFGEGAVNLKSKNDVVEAMLCKECGE